MSSPMPANTSPAFFEVEGRHYDANDRLIPTVQSISQLSAESRLIPVNNMVARASALGPLRDGWGLGGISPVHPSIFVAHKVEFEVGRKMTLGSMDSYGRVGEARGVGKDFVLYAFSEESGREGQHPITCLVVTYNDPQNSIPIRFRLRHFFFQRSLPSIWEFKVPYPIPARGSVSLPPAISTSSHQLTSSASILAENSEAMDLVNVPAEEEMGEVDIREVGLSSALGEGM